jgi:hypothetical protein
VRIRPEKKKGTAATTATSNQITADMNETGAPVTKLRSRTTLAAMDAAKASDVTIS